VLYWNRESFGIVSLANLFGRRGSAVVSVDSNLVTVESFTAGDGQDRAIDLVFGGLANLHKMDQEKATQNRDYWIPRKQVNKEHQA